MMQQTTYLKHTHTQSISCACPSYFERTFPATTIIGHMQYPMIALLIDTRVYFLNRHPAQ